MTMLHIIHPTGPVTSKEWTGALEYAAPPFSEIRKMIGGTDVMVEHVNVLWKGRRAHMFVDEDGLRKQLLFNYKASAIYANATGDKVGLQKYNDLSEQPVDHPRSLTFNQYVIVGTAVLWEGELE